MNSHFAFLTFPIRISKIISKSYRSYVMNASRNGEIYMDHDKLEANLLDHALTKYLKSTKQLDEATVPKHVNNVRGFILRIIYRHGSCTIKDILKEVTLSPSATTTALNHLEQEGFIERSRNNNDRRTVWITLSESGGERLNK